MRTGHIYALHRGDYKFRYVGYTTRDPKARLNQHRKDALSGSALPVHRWLRKYRGTVQQLVIETVVGQPVDILNAEIKWIAILDTFHNGLNCTAGGQGLLGQTHSDETKRKMSEARIKNPSTITPETRLKMNESLKSRVFTAEHRAKLSETSLGRVMSNETRSKISESAKGRIAPNKGVPHSDSTKKAMSDAQRRRVTCECGYVSSPQWIGRHKKTAH